MKVIITSYNFLTQSVMVFCYNLKSKKLLEIITNLYDLYGHFLDVVYFSYI